MFDQLPEPLKSRISSDGGAARGGGGGGGGAPFAHMRGAMRHASAAFMRQCMKVDSRLQSELGAAPPPAPVGTAPWEQGEEEAGAGSSQ
jgi:hypothetical protein